MRILVTGATGFLGGRLVRVLAAAGHRVVGLASEDATVGGVAIRGLDLGDAAGLRSVVAEEGPDLVVHLGGLSHVGESWNRPGDYLRVNFDGTRALLEAAAGRRVLFASSAEVYGRVPESDQPIREDRALDPRSPYAMTKACAESLVLAAGQVVVRSFNVVGAGQARRFAFPSFASQLAAIARGAAEPVLRVGNLSPRRDFVHVDDAIDALVLLVETEGRAGVFNLATGTSVSIGEALDLLIARTGLEVEVVVEPERFRPVDLPLLCGDPGRLRGLGWVPTRGLEQALADVWDEAGAERQT